MAETDTERLEARYLFRDVKREEAEETADIEEICFPPNEACTRPMMRSRVAAAPETFLVAVDRANGRIAGFLNGIATDETCFRDDFFVDASLHNPGGANIMLLGLDVRPEYRGQGLARELMRRYAQRERARGRQRLLLTCLEDKVAMYLRFGYRDLGMSASVWGGEAWHEMDLMLTEPGAALHKEEKPMTLMENPARDAALTERFVSREEIYDGKIVHLERWQVALPDGTPAQREVITHKGASAVVALDEAGQVLLVRQHRIAVGRLTWEIPAGKLDSVQEDPLVCAKRELSEETGFTADHWTELTCMETTPGFCNERIHIYLATGLHAGATHPDEDEFITCARLPLKDAVRLVMDGTLRDGKTCLALLMAEKTLARQS